jgi:hypothetical protein
MSGSVAMSRGLASLLATPTVKKNIGFSFPFIDGEADVFVSNLEDVKTQLTQTSDLSLKSLVAGGVQGFIDMIYGVQLNDASICDKSMKIIEVRKQVYKSTFFSRLQW